MAATLTAANKRRRRPHGPYEEDGKVEIIHSDDDEDKEEKDSEEKSKKQRKKQYVAVSEALLSSALSTIKDKEASATANERLLPPLFQIVIEYLSGNSIMRLYESPECRPWAEMIALARLRARIARFKGINAAAFTDALRASNVGGGEAVMTGGFILDALELVPHAPSEDCDIYVHVPEDEIKRRGGRVTYDRRHFTPIEDYLWSVATPGCLPCADTTADYFTGANLHTARLNIHAGRAAKPIGTCGPQRSYFLGGKSSDEDYTSRLGTRAGIVFISNYLVNGIKFQVIGTHLGAAECVRRCFDFRCLVNYWDGNTLTIHHPEDIARRIARPRADYKYTYPLHMFYRAAKYIRKGFQVTDAQGNKPLFTEYPDTGFFDQFYLPLLQEMKLIRDQTPQQIVFDTFRFRQLNDANSVMSSK